MSAQTLKVHADRDFSPPVRVRNWQKPIAFDRLEEVPDAPLVIVQAPAGYGKTSLLAHVFHQHLQAQRDAVWLNLGPSAATPRQFLNQLVLGFARTVLGARSTALATLLASREGAEEHCMDVLLAECADRRISLFLDNADHLEGSDAQLVNHLLRNSGPEFVVYAASRRLPPIDLTDFRGWNEVIDIRVADLALDYRQTESLVGEAFSTAVPASFVEAVHDGSDGWHVGINLAIQAARADGPRSDSKRFLRKWQDLTSAYFDAHVANALSGSQRDYLRAAMILERFDDRLVASAGYDGALTAQDLLDQGVPITPTRGGEGLWAVNPAFRCHLKDLPDFRSEQAQEVATKKSLARDLLRRGLHSQAIRSLMSAGDLDGALRAIGESFDHLLEAGNVWELRDWYDELPASEVLADDGACIAFAWAFLFAYDLDKVHPLLAQLERSVSRAGAKSASVISAHVLAIRMAAASLDDDFGRSLELGRKWREQYEAVAPVWLLRHVSNTLTFAAMYSSDDREKTEAKFGLQSARFWDDSITADLPLIYHHYYVARCHLQEGDFTNAAIRLDKAEKAAADLPSPSLSATFMPMALWGLIHWERGEFDKVRTVVEDHLEQIFQRSTVQVCHDAAFVVARTHSAQRDLGKAIDVLDRLEAAKTAPPSDRRMLEIMRERLRILFFRNDILEAERVLSEMIDLSQAAQRKGGFWSEHIDDVMLSSQGLVEYGRARYAKAAEALAILLEKLDRRGALYQAAQVRALLAAAYWKNGDTQRAQTHAGQVLRFGRQARLKWTLLDWFPVLEPVLRAYIDQARQGNPLSEEYLTATYALNFVFDARNGVDLGDCSPEADRLARLTERELEIFRLAGAGFSNKAIANQLAVSDNTVKWHLKNAYEKTGARSRVDVLRLTAERR